MKAKVLTIAAMFLICAITAAAQAQQADPGNNNNGGGRGGRGGRGGGNWDPAAMRQQMLDRLKTDLGAKDDEWAVLSPKVDKVMTLSFQARMSRGGMFGRNRGGTDRGGSTNGGGTPPGGDSAVAKAQVDLQSALDDKSIGPDEIAKRLTNLRQAKDSAKQELAKAQAELKELLNQRQEAVLVVNGMLEQVVLIANVAGINGCHGRESRGHGTRFIEV